MITSLRFEANADAEAPPNVAPTPEPIPEDPPSLSKVVGKNIQLFLAFLIEPVYAAKKGREKDRVALYRDWTSVKNLSVVNKMLHIRLSKHILNERTAAMLRHRAAERDLRTEVGRFWKDQWQRMQEVAEKNRELRFEPLEKERLDRIAAEAAQQNVVALERANETLVKPIPVDEANASLKEISNYSSDAIGSTAKREIINLKSAFAQFFTAWSKAAEIAPIVNQEDDFRKHVLAMSAVPKDWSAKDWAKQAVHAMTERADGSDVE